MSDVWKQLEAMRQHLKPHIRITEEVLRAMLDQHKTVTNERDALAAHVEALRKSGNRAICYGGNESSDDWHEVVSQSPTTSLARRDLIKQAEALELAVEICKKEKEGQDKLAWMDKEMAPDGEAYIGSRGIGYSNKALGATHCMDELKREAANLRQRAKELNQ